VFLAEHTLLRRRAALKILHTTFSQRDDIVERFFNEARAATTIADPGIIQVFDFGYHSDTAYIVMELLEGESLDGRLKRLGRLPAMDVLRLTRQLSLSLSAAHQRGVIHRDLKPENIFVVPDLEVFGGERTKILDFGIAKLSDLETNRLRTQTGLMMGTPVYMSPEQCRGSGSIDHRADIYSLGCVMFQMLTGRPPFDHEGGGELIAAHLKEIAPAPSTIVEVLPAVDAIVARCLAKEPHERFSTMHELALELDQVLRTGTFPPHAQLTPIPTQPTMIAVSPRKARWPLAFAAAMIVGLAGATTAAVLIRHHDSAVANDEGPPKSAAVPPPVVAPVVAKPTPAPPPPPPQATPIPTPPIPATTSQPTPPIVHKRHVLPPRPTPPPQSGSATVPTPPPPTDPYDDR
ncbi:MAG TPA: serine/threonine-protein kinase, partial [Kofleriaceae bacterium]|nr:serine/threonine-protein kinase [Kofleriaceae bacterium]